MDLLAGWTVAVTADRRASEQAELLQRHGADVLLAPTVVTTTAENEVVAGATRRALAAPVDHVVVTTGIGLRSWVAMAWSWGLGEPLLDLLTATPVWARGSKAVGALLGEGVDARRHAPGDTLAQVLHAMRAVPLAGTRIVVQSPGSDQRWFIDALSDVGAEVIEVPVYRVAATSSPVPIARLAAANSDGQLDAVTFTSPIAVAALTERPDLIRSLQARHVSCACVGPVTEAAAIRAGLGNLVVPSTHRMGPMLRALGEHMAERGTSFVVDGIRIRHQGSRLAIDDAVVRLTPRERRLLEAMLNTRGAVLSKERLAAMAWDEPVDTHTVEVTVNRLRRKLGPAAAAVETTNRRGYRIAI